ncbi:MAG TPA: hypothetical protein VKT49_07705 [Bryobacteraceae bacterium]|nr:hypothetical protein [Bryobacteraceae bacterium]
MAASLKALTVAAIALASAAPAWCQTTASAKVKTASKTWAVPRTPDGQPDLQGTWSNTTLTPLERPAELAGKAYLTEQEAAEWEKRTFANLTGDRRDGGADADVARSYNEFWRDRGTKVIGSRRTSLIVDPPDGRVPALTPEAQKRVAQAAAAARAHSTDGPEYQNLWVRCLTRGLPMLPGPYNNDFQIVQTPGAVVILHEMIHDVRVIPLDGRPHLPSDVRQWLGDGRGHWEGDTLVVDTTNFSEKDNFRGSGANLHLIERFTRVGPDEISYRFTVDDSTTFTRPWEAEVPMTRADGQIFEYACHEGNYALADILRGARAQEAAQNGSKQGSK